MLGISGYSFLIFISHWSLKNSILLNVKAGLLPFGIQEYPFHFFSFYLLHFLKGGWLPMSAVSHMHGKYFPQEQTPLGCRMAVETQILAGLCV